MKTDFLADLAATIASGPYLNECLWRHRHSIVRAALDGDATFTHEAIGEDDADVNSFSRELGLLLIHRSRATDEPAIYVANDGSNEWAMVADCNGPIVIRLAD
jgi:hypothetical protein